MIRSTRRLATGAMLNADANPPFCGLAAMQTSAVQPRRRCSLAAGAASPQVQPRRRCSLAAIDNV